MINIIRYPSASNREADPAEGAGGLFGVSSAPTPNEINAEILRELARHTRNLEMATAGFRDVDDDQWIVDDILASLEKRGLAVVAERIEIRFYQVTAAGVDALAAIDAGQTVELTDPQEAWHRGA